MSAQVSAAMPHCSSDGVHGWRLPLLDGVRRRSERPQAKVALLPGPQMVHAVGGLDRLANSRSLGVDPEIELLCLGELPHSQLDCPTNVMIFAFARCEASEGIVDRPYEWLGVPEVGTQVTNKVKPEPLSNVARASTLPLVPAHRLNPGINA